MNLSVPTRWVMSATLVMACTFGIGRFAYTPLLPDMVDAFGWTFAAAGDVASANFLGYMFGALLAPKIAASPYVRFWLAMSLMATVATTYLGAELSSFWPWVAIRFASGVVSAFCMVVITTKLIHVLQDQGRESLGNVHFAGVGIGIVLCMVLLYQPGDVAEQWSRLTALAALFAVLAWLLIADQPFTSMSEPATPQSGEGLGRALWRLIVGYGLFGYGYVVAATFIVAIAREMQPVLTGRWQGFDARTVWLVVGISLTPSVYLWQWLANRYGMLSALKAAYLVEAVGMVMAVYAGDPFWLMMACVLLGGTFAAITALGLSAAKQAAPDRVAFVVSAMTLAFAIGQFIGPAISGRMADVFGDFKWASLLGALALVIAALLVSQPDRPAKRT